MDKRKPMKAHDELQRRFLLLE